MAHFLAMLVYILCTETISAMRVLSELNCNVGKTNQWVRLLNKCMVQSLFGEILSILYRHTRKFNNSDSLDKINT